jgi:DNA-binding NarL/FixJ family response regulator
VSRGLRTERGGSASPKGERPRVALIAAGGVRRRIGRRLEEENFEWEPVDAIDELTRADADPSLIVLWVEGSLPEVVSRDLGPLRRELEQTPIVLVCSGVRARDFRVALSGGAAAIVLDSELSTALGPAMRAVLAGQVSVPRQHSDEIEPATLSARERQILGLVVMGYMNSQIAEQLFVAESTVKSHLSSAFAKLGVRSRTEAADLILDSNRGLGVGILALEGEPLETTPAAT